MVFYESISYKKSSFYYEKIQIFKYVNANENNLKLLYRCPNIIVESVYFKILPSQSF